jgi:hypothetical protein
MIPRIVICLLSLCGLLSACKSDPDARLASPEGTVSEFYTWRVRQVSMAMPSEQQLAELRPYVSNELYGLLSQASAQARKAKPKPNRKRTFIDGDLFSSLSNGPTSFHPGEAERKSENDVVIPVRLTAAQQLPAVHWVDRVRLIREEDRYVIADVHYANHWSVGDNQTLVAALKKQAKRKKA